MESSRWLVLTDSSALSKAATSHERVVALEAPKVHISYKLYVKQQVFDEAQYVDSLVQTYAEWFMLSDASVMVSDFRSGFARTALFASLARREQNWAAFAVVNPRTCVPWGRRL